MRLEKAGHIAAIGQFLLGIPCAIFAVLSYQAQVLSSHALQSANAPSWSWNMLTPIALPLAVAFLAIISMVGAIVNFIGWRRRTAISAPTDSVPSSDAQTSRLKIISAHYGVEGGPDPDVYEKYLKPKIHGDALVGWVGADLFGGYQPVINAYKRLKVRYSFEGREHTIVRGENQMIVIPEDDVLKEEIEDCEKRHKSAIAYVNELRERINSLADGSVSESDPLVYPEFVDARFNGSDKKELQAYFAVENRGGGEAFNIVLEPVEMGGKVVQFTRHRIAAALSPKKGAFFYPDVVTKENQSVPESSRDLFHLFCLDYISLGDSTIIEATTSLIATYQDKARNLFEVTCELVFDPAAHADVRMGNRGVRPVICTRNHKFRKVAIAALLHSEGKK